MKLVLHLLRKDIRQWTYEITVTILVLFTAAFTAVDSNANSRLMFVASLSSFFAPLMLVLLAGRVLQGERWPSPLEDWRTRPLPRMHMAAAKGLFLALIIVLPTCLSYWVTFRGLGYGSGVWLQEAPALLFGLIAMLILPAAAVMAVTSNLGQAVLATMCLFLGIMTVSLSRQPHYLSTTPPMRSINIVFFALLAAVTLAALYWQILRDRTWVARGVLTVGCFAVAVFGMSGQLAETGWLWELLDPEPQTLHPIAVKLTKPDGIPPEASATALPELVPLQFPLELSGVPDGMVAELGQGSVLIRWPEGGVHRLLMAQEAVMPGKLGTYTLMFKRADYANVRTAPLDLELHVWTHVYSNPKDYAATMINHRVAIPDLFECSLDPSQTYPPNQVPVFTAPCTTALSSLGRLDFNWTDRTSRIQFHSTAYGNDGTGLWRSVGGAALRQRFYSGNLLSRWEDGQQVEVRHYRNVAHVHRVLKLRAIHLDDYRRY
ncbi:hypothetical protein [uncultured Paludibaculum sp.]|uniref:hypothetical protein n=1 Tax=uncultured Paludibaculum sp. TaxID=1765020 RepID=UPI002AAAD199|nr:hypothetical protein [uncultured Paludibaculum sp.]